MSTQDDPAGQGTVKIHMILFLNKEKRLLGSVVQTSGPAKEIPMYMMA